MMHKNYYILIAIIILLIPMSTAASIPIDDWDFKNVFNIWNVSNITIDDGVTIGGVRRTTWPGGAGGDPEINQNVNTTGSPVFVSINITGNATSDTDFCVAGGNCLSTVSAGGGGGSQWTINASELENQSTILGVNNTWLNAISSLTNYVLTTAFTAENTSIRALITTNTNNIASNLAALIVTNSTLNTVSMKVDNVNTTLETVSIKVDNVNVSLETLNGLHTTDNTSIWAVLNSNLAKILTTNNTLNIVSTKVDNVNATLETVSIKVDNVNSTLETTRTQVTNVNATLETLSTKVDNVNVTLEVVSTKVDNVNVTLETVSTKVDNVNDTNNILGLLSATDIDTTGDIYADNFSASTDFCIESGSCLSDAGVGSGDITAVNTNGPYLDGGSASGAVSLTLLPINYTYVLNHPVNCSGTNTFQIGSDNGTRICAAVNDSDIDTNESARVTLNVVNVQSVNNTLETVSTKVDNVNTTVETKATAGNCAEGAYVMNTTTSGVQCLTPAGGGDITAVNTNGPNLYGGGVTGAISLLFNETYNNATITALDTDTNESERVTSLTALQLADNISVTTRFGDYVLTNEFVAENTSIRALITTNINNIASNLAKILTVNSSVILNTAGVQSVNGTLITVSTKVDNVNTTLETVSTKVDNVNTTANIESLITHTTAGNLSWNETHADTLYSDIALEGLHTADNTSIWVVLSSNLAKILTTNVTLNTVSTKVDNVNVTLETVSTKVDNMNTTSNMISLLTTSAMTFTTVDTGFGANELYDMNQNVLEASNVIFNNQNLTGNLTMLGGFLQHYNGSCIISKIGNTQDVLCP